MSESPPPATQSKLIRSLQKRIKDLEEEIAFLQKENSVLEARQYKQVEVIEYYYILDDEENVLTGFFKKRLTKA